MISNFILVGLGGAIGAMMRHGAGLVALRLSANAFPWGTLAVNVIGSLCIGLFVGLLALMTAWSHEVRLFVVVGILGGFTTFSAFSLDIVSLIEREQMLSAILYCVGSVLLSVAATFLGLFMVRAVV